MRGGVVGEDVFTVSPEKGQAETKREGTREHQHVQDGLSQEGRG